MPHCTIHYGSDVQNNLEWVGKLSGPLLLNNNLLARRDMTYVIINGRRLVENRMRYTVEPSDVPLLILPQIPLPCLSTPLRLSKDMDHKILRGHNHVPWLKSPNHRRRSENGLIIAILPENPLRQVKAHHVFAGHDPTRVLADVV